METQPPTQLRAIDEKDASQETEHHDHHHPSTTDDNVDWLTVWENSSTEKDREKAFSDTLSLISAEIEKLVRAGLEAFHQTEKMEREVKMWKEKGENKDAELDRLRTADEKCRSTITNLLTALEASRVEVCDSSRATLSEATLRTELGKLRGQYDEAKGQANEFKRKAHLFQEELRQTKTKLSRVTQEKVKMERDQRMTMTLAKSMDSSQATADVDYYKRKVSELSSGVQSMTAILNEKNRQIENLRHQVERGMSQERLAKWRVHDENARK